MLSGGLDSVLAVKVIEEQGIDVTAMTFETPFFSANRGRKSAEQLGIPIIVIDITDDYLPMLRNPRYGYGRNMNPCIDCHGLMLKKSGNVMRERGFDFIVTGEVLGQRPMSQNRQALHVVAKLSGCEEHIVRPLSAQLLPETIPEKEGKVVRMRLLDIQGRGRKRQMELADRYAISEYSTPAGGCQLTDPAFSKRLRDLLDHQDQPPSRRDFELLKHGRHLRLSENVKIIVGRNRLDNGVIEQLAVETDMMCKVRDYPGPTVLIPGGCDEKTLVKAAGICIRYSDAPKDKNVAVSSAMEIPIRILDVEAADRSETDNLVIV